MLPMPSLWWTLLKLPVQTFFFNLFCFQEIISFFCRIMLRLLSLTIWGNSKIYVRDHWYTNNGINHIVGSSWIQINNNRLALSLRDVMYFTERFHVHKDFMTHISHISYECCVLPLGDGGGGMFWGGGGGSVEGGREWKRKKASIRFFKNIFA